MKIESYRIEQEKTMQQESVERKDPGLIECPGSGCHNVGWATWGKSKLNVRAGLEIS